jgi:ParB family chromosome partitioning protein
MAFNLGASNNSGKLQFADFLGADTPVANVEKEIPIELLVPWENQPFKLYGEFKLNELAESIKENGLLSPIIVCPIDGGKYRIIAGHNRVEACRIAGITNIPSIVKDVDENRAKLIMADTNLCQRTELLPSERAYAYKAQQEALIALGSSRSTAEISEKYGEAKRTIQRYIACTRLVTELMEILDSGRITLNTAVLLSGMPVPSQKEVASYLAEDASRRIDFEQAKQLTERKFISEKDIIEIVDGVTENPCAELSDKPKSLSNNAEKKKSSANQFGKKITLKRKEITEIIGSELTNDEISEYFYFCLQRKDILEEWHRLYTEIGKNDGIDA